MAMPKRSRVYGYVRVEDSMVLPANKLKDVTEGLLLTINRVRTNNAVIILKMLFRDLQSCTELKLEASQVIRTGTLQWMQVKPKEGSFTDFELQQMAHKVSLAKNRLAHGDLDLQLVGED